MFIRKNLFLKRIKLLNDTIVPIYSYLVSENESIIAKFPNIFLITLPVYEHLIFCLRLYSFQAFTAFVNEDNF